MFVDTSTSTSNSNFASIFNAALKSYKSKTKKDLTSHPLLPRLQSCDSPEAILTALREKIPAFDQSQNGDDRLTKWVSPTVNVLYAFSATVGQGVGLVCIRIFCTGSFVLTYFQAFPPANAVFTGIGVLLMVGIFMCRLPRMLTPGSQAAKDASTGQEKITEIFNRIEHFFRRLEIYTVLTPTAAMADMIVEIMVEVLTILAIATKEVKRGPLSESISRGSTLLD
jgi:hypothetical protein